MRCATTWYVRSADRVCSLSDLGLFSKGNEAWMSALEHDFHSEFAASEATKWVTTETGRVSGQVRSAGGGEFGAGNVTFVEVFEAGYVVYGPRVLVVKILIALRFLDTWSPSISPRRLWCAPLCYVRIHPGTYSLFFVLGPHIEMDQ